MSEAGLQEVIQMAVSATGTNTETLMRVDLHAPPFPSLSLCVHVCGLCVCVCVRASMYVHMYMCVGCVHAMQQLCLHTSAQNSCTHVHVHTYMHSIRTFFPHQQALCMQCESGENQPQSDTCTEHHSTSPCCIQSLTTSAVTSAPHSPAYSTQRGTS